MQDADHNPYETGYDAPTLPYVPPPSEQTTYREQALPMTPLPEVYGHEEAQTGPYAMPPISATPASPPEIEGPKRKRRTLWIVLASVVALLVIVSLAAYQLVTYINRPTPGKTLDAFCNGLLHDDYHSAYGQFSKGIQAQFSEIAFTNDIEQDKIVSCSHGDASDAGSSASTNLRLVHSSKGINKDIVILTRDSANNWKINDLRKQV
jgi:hypothetical protein